MSGLRARMEAWRLVPLPLVASRLLWFGVAVAVIARTMPGTPIPSALRNALISWDARHYLEIAANGYPASRCSAVECDYHDAFLPGLPMLIRAVAVVARDDVLAGWLVCLVAEAIALFYIARLVIAERDRGTATFSVWLIALAPTAVFFIAPFTESPFVAAVAASLFYARQGKPRAAGIAGAVASTLRLTGLALLPALALEHLMRRRGRLDRHLLYVLLVPLPFVLFCVYLRLHTGDALAYFDAQHSSSFNHTLASPLDGFWSAWNNMAGTTDGESRSIWAREVAFGLLGLAGCIAMWAMPRIPASFALYCTVAWLFASSLSFWRSQPRYDLALFPAVLVAADLTRRLRAARPVLVIASAALMCAGTSIYTQGRWLG